MAGAFDSTAYKLARTFFKSFGGFTYGISMGMLGPSIPEFCSRQGVSVEQLAWLLSSSYVFMLVASLVQGCILGRLLPKRYHDYYYSGCSLVLAVVSFVKSRTSSFWLFAVAYIIEFMSYPAYDIVIDSDMLEMWGSRADPAIQLWHFTWALGFAVGPLIVRAYFPDEAVDLGLDTNEQDVNGGNTLDATNDSSDYSNPYGMHNISTVPTISFVTELTNNTSVAQNTSMIEKSYTAIEMPFTITSLCFLSIAVVNIAFIIKERKFKRVNVDQHVQVHSNQWEESRCFVITMCIMLVLFYFCLNGSELVFHTWVFSFAMDSALNFTKPEAALLDSTSKFMFAGSKLVFTPLSMVIPCQVLLFIEVIGCLVVVVPLALIGTNSKINLWVLCSFYNLFLGPLWGAFKGWMDKYVKITPTILGLMYIGVGTSGMLLQVVSGYIITNDPGALMYLIVLFVTLLLVVTIGMQVRASCHGIRYAKPGVDGNIKEVDDVADGELETERNFTAF